MYLVRHAQSAANADGVLAGQQDAPLTETGHAQVRALAARLAAMPLAAVYTSDLDRARETAAGIAAAHGLASRPDPRLREMDYGRWEGRPGQELEPYFATRRADIETPDAAFAFPGGEALGALRARLRAAYADVIHAHPGATVVLVSHGTALAALIADLLDLPFASSWRLRLDSAALSCIEQWDATPVLALFNDTAHLPQAD